MTAVVNRQEVRELAQKITALADWLDVKTFVEQLYGPNRVVYLTIETYREYNDEGGTSYCLENFEAKDANHQRVRPDFSLPFFYTQAWKDAVADCSPEEEDDADDEYNEQFFSILREVSFYGEEQLGFLTLEDIPVHEDNETYDLSMPPFDITVLSHV